MDTPAKISIKPSVTVRFDGGPWNGITTAVHAATGPVFAPGHEIGNHYWLDTNSDPPVYFWDGEAADEEPR